jgi:hypothetical protein
MNGFVEDSEDNMPVDETLLDAPSGEELARQRQYLYRTAIALAAQIAVVSYTSRPKDQLGDAHRFLASRKIPPLTELKAELSRIQHLLAMISAAVTLHCDVTQHQHSALNIPSETQPPVQITGD